MAQIFHVVSPWSTGPLNVVHRREHNVYTAKDKIVHQATDNIYVGSDGKANFDFVVVVFFLTTVLSYWDFFLRKFGLLPSGKVSCDRVALPNIRYMMGVSVFL